MPNFKNYDKDIKIVKNMQLETIKKHYIFFLYYKVKLLCF